MHVPIDGESSGKDALPALSAGADTAKSQKGRGSCQNVVKAGVWSYGAENVRGRGGELLLKESHTCQR